MTRDGITITTLTPNHGPATGGTDVVISGSGFPDYPVVTIGGRPAPVTGRSLTGLTVSAPGGTAGTSADVTVADRAGHSVTQRRGYRYDGTAPAAGGGTTPAPGGAPGGSTPGGSTPGGSTPGGGNPGGAPGGSPGGSTPGGPVPAGPAGSVYRPAPELGSTSARNGLRLAPITGNDPFAGMPPARWAQHRCERAGCAAVPLA